MAHGTFVTAINCMDGRTQCPVAHYLKGEFKADYVDTITEPGPDGLLATGNSATVESIKKRVLISVNAHHSKVVAVVSHDDCAGNPVSKAEHLDHLAKAIDVVKSWQLPVRILGLWVNEQWVVEVISDTGA